jgi:hypothetical protein
MRAPPAGTRAPPAGTRAPPVGTQKEKKNWFSPNIFVNFEPILNYIDPI